jgi:enterochelin esterase-like enzyme
MRFVVFVAVIISALSSLAQSTTSTNAPARQPPVYSPEIHGDGKVTFRIRAPKASEVKLSGEWSGEQVDLNKGEDDIWTATVGPLPPELYGYAFMVDGLRIADPGNPDVKAMRSPTTSVLEIPGDPPLLHELTRDVPRGAVTMHDYYSDEIRAWRRLHVYTPAGYERNNKRYPVLYLFHGSGDTDASWTQFGRANVILDNLIASEKAQPMIVVMPDGHPLAERVTGVPGPEIMRKNLEAFAEDILKSVIPFTETRYRVRKDAAARAVAGQSMGGGQSLALGLNHPGMFGYVAGFSAHVAEPKEAKFKIFDAVRKPQLIWLACGKDDFLIQNQRDFSATLSGHGIRHEFLVTEGNHSWPVWRKYLAQLAPVLFQEK